MRSIDLHHIDADRACAAWNRIQERPTDVVLIRDSSPLTAQCMRVEIKHTSTEESSKGLKLGERSNKVDVVLFGIKDHPSETDTDMQRNDRFELDSLLYDIQTVYVYQGEIQGHAEAQI